jgi:DNA-binding LacI/PurR family transcriptional regulator
MLPEKKAVNLRTVAERVGLAPCSVSAILNNTPASRVIPQSTKDRVFRAAAELNYRPNLWARSLRTKRTRMVAAITSDFGRSDIARVIAGLQSRLHRRGYLLALGALDASETNHTCVLFQQRGVEGVIAIDATVPQKMDLPAAFVDLGYMNSVELLTHDMQAWLSELGAAAAETIIRQIEKEDTPRRMKVEPKLPPAYFDLLHAGSSAEADVRESAQL